MSKLYRPKSGRQIEAIKFSSDNISNFMFTLINRKFNLIIIQYLAECGWLARIRFNDFEDPAKEITISHDNWIVFKDPNNYTRFIVMDDASFHEEYEAV